MDKCLYCDRTNDLVTSHGGKYCRKHYYHIRTFGEVVKTIYDKNDIVTYDNYAEIILRDMYSNEVGRAIVDIEDLDLIVDFKWSLNGHGYARTRLKDGSMLQMHKLITNTDSETVTDHIDRNRINNRKENLRVVTRSENAMNKSIQSNNSSGIAGVSYYKDRNKWVAEMKYEGKKIYLGAFKDKIDAIKARLKKEHEMFGELAPQKHLFEEYDIREDDAE